MRALLPMRTTEQLRKAGSESISVDVMATAAEAIALFQAHPGLRILPVLSATREPIGAIFEEDVRQILFNPYGHALLRKIACAPARQRMWVARSANCSPSTPTPADRRA
jgi:methyl-accepting chemotaxis protein